DERQEHERVALEQRRDGGKHPGRRRCSLARRVLQQIAGPDLREIPVLDEAPGDAGAHRDGAGDEIETIAGLRVETDGRPGEEYVVRRVVADRLQPLAEEGTWIAPPAHLAVAAVEDALRLEQGRARQHRPVGSERSEVSAREADGENADRNLIR